MAPLWIAVLKAHFQTLLKIVIQAQLDLLQLIPAQVLYPFFV